MDELIYDSIELTIEGERYQDKLFAQLDSLKQSKREHTGVGLFVYFNHTDTSDNRLTESELEEMFGLNNHSLTKFELRNKKLKIKADITVHFKQGLIECVEIWNKLGDYPTEELLTYKLKRLS